MKRISVSSIGWFVCVWPVSILALGAAIHHPTGWDLLGVLLAVVWHFAVLGIGVNGGSYLAALHARREFVSQLGTCTLTRVPVLEAVSASCLEDLPQKKTFDVKYMRERWNVPENWERLRIYHAEFRSPPYPTALKAYSSLIGTSFVFLLDAVDRSDALDEFRRHHEFAHVTKMGHAASQHSLVDGPLSAMIVASVALSMSMGEFAWYWWILLAAFLCVRLYDARIVSTAWAEAAADAYGMRCLTNRNDRDAVLRLHENIWRSQMVAQGVTYRKGLELHFRLSSLTIEANSQHSGNSRMRGWNSPLSQFYLIMAPFFLWVGWKVDALPSHLLLMLALSAAALLWLGGVLCGRAVREERLIAHELEAREG